MMRHIIPCWPMVLGLGVGFLGIAVFLALEIWASRPPRGGYAGPEEITKHRLSVHHGFDPEKHP